jgi:hypothetical protein
MFGFRALVKRLTLSAPVPGSLAGRDPPAPDAKRTSARGAIADLAGKAASAVSPLSFAHLFGVKQAKAPARERGAALVRAQRERGDDALATVRGNVDTDQDMQGDSLLARARARERARCAAIMGSAEGQRNPMLAANLAFKTRITRVEALALLAGTAPVATSLHPERASRNPRIGAFVGSGASPGAMVAAGWDRAFAQANQPAAGRSRLAGAREGN